MKEIKIILIVVPTKLERILDRIGIKKLKYDEITIMVKDGRYLYDRLDPRVSILKVIESPPRTSWERWYTSKTIIYH